MAQSVFTCVAIDNTEHMLWAIASTFEKALAFLQTPGEFDHELETNLFYIEEYEIDNFHGDEPIHCWEVYADQYKVIY